MYSAVCQALPSRRFPEASFYRPALAKMLARFLCLPESAVHSLRKIKRAIDESMTMTQYVGSEDADLTVRDLAYGTNVLPRHPAQRLALLEKASLVDHQDCIVIRQMLDDIIADDIAQAIRIPIPAPQDRLLPPRARIAQLPPRASNRFCVAPSSARLPSRLTTLSGLKERETPNSSTGK
jgi:hypothetical protein